VSESYIGKAHDFSILKAEFEPHQGWFKAHEVELDLGYIGFAKNYECKQLNIPHKKKKNKELTPVQKQENKEISSTRIRVEHSIGGMKKFHILKHKLRLKDFSLYDDIVEACAGLWNFTQKYPTH
jgi:hypothetical protein